MLLKAAITRKHILTMHTNIYIYIPYTLYHIHIYNIYIYILYAYYGEPKTNVSYL